MISKAISTSAVGLILTFATSLSTAADERVLQPLPSADSGDPKQIELGRMLFFDPRLSGDATISCATCHNPDHGWADGLPLSAGYPGSRYFRNTPTVMNAARNRFVYWDGRLPASDLPTVVRDHISEAHFLQADGRLVIERMRQVPVYEQKFEQAFGGEPTYGRILNAVAAFVRSLRSQDVPLDRYLNGETEAFSESAQRGLELFTGKAACIRCHHGSMLSDGNFHSLGLESNPAIFSDPQRHITFRRFFRTLGVPGYEHLKQDIGRRCVSKAAHDQELIRTPSLREVSRTAPYMHDGQLQTLADVVAFYNRGGGPRESKDDLLQPLNLSDEEQADLVAFLESLAGAPLETSVPEPPPYALRELGAN